MAEYKKKLTETRNYFIAYLDNDIRMVIKLKSDSVKVYSDPTPFADEVDSDEQEYLKIIDEVAAFARVGDHPEDAPPAS